VVNELLLVALGLGQYRAEDGNTTVFESGSLFDEEVVPAAKAQPTASASGTAGSSSASSEEAVRAGDVGAQISDAGAKTWSAIRGGATASWRGITTASTNVKDLVSGETGAQQPQHQRTSSKSQPKAKNPTKPNDVCHYDARGRALVSLMRRASTGRSLTKRRSGSRRLRWAFVAWTSCVMLLSLPERC
jgi:hypothetical protein